MTVGRKPTPSIVKKLTGNPGKRKFNAREPKAAVGLPKCPQHITGEARREWKRIGAQMVEEKRMAPRYKAALAAYCVAWGRWADAEKHVQEFGTVIKSPSGFLIQSPYLPIANKAWSQMMKALAELGISPTSQARAMIVDTESDEFEEFDGLTLVDGGKS